jgi:hypothetical protein
MDADAQKARAGACLCGTLASFLYSMSLKGLTVIRA